MEAGEFIEHFKSFGLPILGAVAGFVTTSYGVRTRVRNLEKAFGLSKKAWKTEFDTLKTDLARKNKEAKETLDEKLKEALGELNEKFEKLEGALNSWQRESSHSFASDEELTRFMEEQQRQWQSIQRTLGQIEGMMKRLP